MSPWADIKTLFLARCSRKLFECVVEAVGYSVSKLTVECVATCSRALEGFFLRILFVVHELVLRYGFATFMVQSSHKTALYVRSLWYSVILTSGHTVGVAREFGKGAYHCHRAILSPKHGCKKTPPFSFSEKLFELVLVELPNCYERSAAGMIKLAGPSENDENSSSLRTSRIYRPTLWLRSVFCCLPNLTFGMRGSTSFAFWDIAPPCCLWGNSK